MKQLVCQCTLICMLGFTTLAESPKTIDLGGPRKVTATVTATDEGFDINVSLIPVRCFDSATNRRLSQEKARSYATEALLRYVGGGKQQSTTISQAEIIEAENVDGRFVLVMRVPSKGLLVTKETEKKTWTKSPELSGLRPLLKAKDDYQETLLIVTKMLTEDQLAYNGKLSDFYEAISKAEELGIARLTSLGKEIKADRWLLSTEREELLQQVAVEEESLITRLRKQVEKVESNSKGEE